MTFKMKGHTLPGIKQLKSNDNEDGRSGSAAFQQSNPLFGHSSKKFEGLEKDPIIPIEPMDPDNPPGTFDIYETKKKTGGGPFDKSVFKDRKTSNGYEQRSVDKHNADWVSDPKTGEYYHANEGK